MMNIVDLVNHISEHYQIRTFLFCISKLLLYHNWYLLDEVMELGRSILIQNVRMSRVYQKKNYTENREGAAADA